MRGVFAVFTRELKGYFDSIIAYVILLAFFFFTTFLTLRDLEAINQATLRPFFSMLPVAFLFFIPALAMRLWSEERKLGTVELLLTWPLKHWQLVLGKFLAGMGVVVVSLIMSLTYWVYVSKYGEPDPGPILGGFLASLLLAGAYLSLSCFISSLTENQVVAFVISVFVSASLYLVGNPFVLSYLPSNWDYVIAAFSAIGFGARFESVARGVLDFSDLAYYALIIALFLFLNVRSVSWQSMKNGSGSGSFQSYMAGTLALGFVILLLFKQVFLIILPIGGLLSILYRTDNPGTRKWLLRFMDNLFAALLAFVLVYQGTLLADRFKYRIDMTEEQRFSLSEISTNVAKDLEDNLYVRCYFSGALPPILQKRKQQTVDMLREYANASNSKISIRFLDPDTDPDARDRAEREGIKAQSVKIQGNGEQALVNRYFGCVMEYLTRKETFQFMPDPSRLESEITAALRNLQTDKKLKISMLTCRETPSTGYRLIQQQLRRQRLKVTRIVREALKDGTPIPDDIDILILYEPDRLSRREAYEIDQYVMKGGKLMILGDGCVVDNSLKATKVVSGLENVLGQWGFEIKQQIVRSDDVNNLEVISFNNNNQAKSGPNPWAVRVPAEGMNPEHSVTKYLAKNKAYVSFNEASPVVTTLSAGVVPLLRVPGPAYSQERMGALGHGLLKFVSDGPPASMRTLRPNEIKNPVVAMAYEGPLESHFEGQGPPIPDGQFKNTMADERRETKVKNDKAQLVIIGDAAFMEPNKWGGPYGQAGNLAVRQNLAFVLNAVDWLAGEADLISLRSRGTKDRRLTFTKDVTPTKRQAGYYIAAPLLLLLLGGVRFFMGVSQRRSIGDQLKQLAEKDPFKRPPELAARLEDKSKDKAAVKAAKPKDTAKKPVEEPAEESATDGAEGDSEPQSEAHEPTKDSKKAESKAQESRPDEGESDGPAIEINPDAENDKKEAEAQQSSGSKKKKKKKKRRK